MAFVAVAAFAELHPLEKMHVERSMADCIKFAQRIGYNTNVCDTIDADGWDVWQARNQTDKSIITFKGTDDKIWLMWVYFPNQDLMPKLHDAETLPYIYHDDVFTRGKYKNYFLFNARGGNFLDPFDPDYIEPEDLYNF